MKKRSIFILPLAWTIVVLSCASAKDGAKGNVAAKVNDQVITVQEVTKVARNFRHQNLPPDPEAKGTTPQEKLYYTAVDRLVEQTLILAEAKKIGILVSDTEVTESVNQLVTMAGGEEKLNKLLAEQGATRADVEKDMRNNLILKGYLDHVKQAIPAVSDTAVKAYYDQHPETFAQPEVHARHILIRVDPTASDMEKAEALKKAQDVLARAKKGEAFDKLAAQFSQDPGSATQGGDLGWFAKGQMVAPFDSAAFALHPGQLSGVVPTQFGYHVIKVEENRTGRPLEEMKEQIRQYLVQQETEKHFRETVTTLKSKATVKIEPPTPAVLDSLQA
jgi:peptidyl-prolyl cis-trans isomerase C